MCEYSRDGDSHRCPWCNSYFPEGLSGLLPSPALRMFENAANEALSAYAAAYFGSGCGGGSSGGSSSSASASACSNGGGGGGGGGDGSGGMTLVTSVFAWELAAPGAFASAWLLSKETATISGGSSGGSGGSGSNGGAWHSFHVAEVAPARAGGRMSYRLTSTVLLAAAGAGSGGLAISGSVTRSATAEHSDGRTHVAAIGALLEQNEADMRAAVASLYLAKSRELVRALRRGGSGGEGGSGGGGVGGDSAGGHGRAASGLSDGSAVAYAAAAALAARRASGGRDRGAAST